MEEFDFELKVDGVNIGNVWGIYDPETENITLWCHDWNSKTLVVSKEHWVYSQLKEKLNDRFKSKS